jgi:hypothetical protein
MASPEWQKISLKSPEVAAASTSVDMDDDIPF